jgi:hypothetical protein
VSEQLTVLASYSVPELVAWGKRALEQAGSVEEVVNVKATAEALAAYAKAVGKAQEAIDAAQEIKVRAERRLGQEKNRAQAAGEVMGRGRPKNITPGGDFRSMPAKVAEIGLTRPEAASYSKLASVPDDVFEAAVGEAKEAGGVTTKGVQRLVEAAAKVAKGLPPDSDPNEVRRAIKAAMREAAGVRKAPSPREADRIALETGEAVWGSDNRWHDGRPTTPEEQADLDGLASLRLALGQLAEGQPPPDRVVALVGWDAANWLAMLAASLDYLAALRVAFTRAATPAHDQETKDAA